MVEDKERHYRKKREREDEQDVHRRAIGPAAANGQRGDDKIRGDEREQHHPRSAA